MRRTTRSMRLTEAGQTLADDSRAHFECIAHSFAGVRGLSGIPRGLLRVTAPVALARQMLVPHVADFLRANPEVRLELELSDRISSLATEGFDLAIRHTNAVPDTHVAWPLCETRSLLVASRSYLRRYKMPKKPQDLTGHDCLYYPRPRELPAWTFHSLRKRSNLEHITVPVSGPFSANNSEALRDAALSGLGIALVPDFSVQAALQAGKLVKVLPDWQPSGTFAEQLFAVRPYANQIPVAVKAFVAFLRDAFSNGFAS